MIDTDKYEGHTPGPWVIECYERAWYIRGEDWDSVCDLQGTAQRKDPTAKLIAAAPDLLAEVKRLREGIEHALHIRLRHGQEEGWEELKELIE